jgi:hypothetical protein
VEFLYGEAVLAAVVELVRSAQGPVRIAVAYVGRDASSVLQLRKGDVIVVNGSDNAVAAGATDPRAIEDWLDADVRVVNHPWLHAKVFVAGRTAIVGSANLSERARSGAIVEAAIRTTQRETAASARDFIDRLIRTEGQDIDRDWIEDAKRRFPPRRVTPPWEDRPPALAGPYRLWLGWWDEPYDLTDALQRTYTEAVTESAPAFRPRARYEPVGTVEEVSADGFFRRGDRVVMLGPRNARLVEFHSIRPAGPGRRSLRIGLYRRDTSLVSVTNASVRRALEAVGSTLPSDDDPDAGRWLEHPAERKAVLDLWQLPDPGVP